MARQQQSPIDLGTARVVPTLRSDLAIDWQPGPQAVTVERREFGYRFTPAGDNTITLEGEPFALGEVHFHRPSEHRVDGARHGAELHAVHHPVDGAPGARRCVIAVFLAVAAECGRPAEPPATIDLTALLPEYGSFYRYEGSLTTRAYDEIVSWVVMKQEVTVADPDLDAFIRFDGDHARDVMARNRRFVLTDEDVIV